MNDLHGKFCDTAAQPGVDELATYLRSREDYDDNVVIFSSGDMWQGAAESNLTNGLILTDWMNSMGFVSMTLGNHEYDWGEDKIRQNLAAAEFPFLAINIYDKSTGRLADYCTPSVVVERDGIQIGIIGAIGDCYSSISADRVTGVEFKTGSQLTTLIQNESTRLRNLGVDIIVLSLHDGTSGYDTSLSNGYIDVCFEGHTHDDYVKTDSYGIYHVQGGGDNEGISHVEIFFNFVNNSSKVTVAEFVSTSIYKNMADDPETEAIEDKYADIIEYAYSTLGTVSTTQSSSTVADIVSELYLKAGLERWGDKYNIVLGGGYISTRSPYSLTAGSVTYSQVLSILPFDNQLVLCKISGSDLKSKFINTTNSNYHNTYSDYGNSIRNSVTASDTYYVVVDMYTAVYAPNRLTIVEYYDDGVFARDLLAAEIKAGRFDQSGGNGGSGGGSNSGEPGGGNTTEEYTLTSIPEIISIGKALGINGITSSNYYVKGRITSVSNSTYGNVNIVDENGNTLLIYGMYDTNGTRYDSMTSKPRVGDTIIVCGPIYYYNGTTVEIKNSTLIDVE